MTNVIIKDDKKQIELQLFLKYTKN